MSETLCWKIVLGCALIAALEIPQGLSLVIQDLSGPYSSAVDTEPISTAHIAPGAASPVEHASPMHRVIESDRTLAFAVMTPPRVALSPRVSLSIEWSDLSENRIDLEPDTSAVALGR